MRPPDKFKYLIAIIYLLLLTASVYNSALVPGRTALPADLLLLTPPWKQHAQELLPQFHAVSRPAWDPLFQFYPARKHLAESLRAGRMPLWNPSSFSGTPFAADDQSAIYYPLNWLFAVLPLGIAFGWLAALHTFLTGLFFTMYGRRMGWGWAASLTGATAWMLCGVMVAWQMWQVVDDSLCWLPLALFFWEGWRRTGRPGQLAGTAIALGLSALAGHLQFTCYVFMAMLAYGIYRSFDGPSREGTTPAQSIGALIGAFALGFGIAAVQLFATADFLQHTQRTESTLKDIMPLMMPPAQLIMLVAPEIFGGQRDWTVHPYLGTYNYYELTVFCGAAALAFAAYGVRWLPSADPARRRTLFWLGVAVFALLMGCGSPMYAVFFYGVPLFKSFHGPARIFILLDLAVAVLAAEGVQRLISADGAERRRLAGRIFGVLFLALIIGYRFAVTSTNHNIGFALTHAEPDGWLTYGMTQLGITVAAFAAACAVIAWAPSRMSWIALGVVAVESLIFAVGVNTSVPSNLLYPPTSETQFVSQNLGDARVWCVGDGNPNNYQSRLVPNSAMALGWNDVAGSDPLILKTYQPIADQLDKAQQSAPAVGEPGSVAPVRPLLDRLNVKYIVSPRPISHPDLKEAASGDVYVYENPTAFGVARLKIEGSDRAESTDVQARYVYPGEIKLIKQALEAGLLTTSVVYDSAWKTTIDGKQAQTRNDSIFLAVPVADGHHVIDFHYQPDSVFVGLFLTCIAWFIVILLLVMGNMAKIH
jgi:hypothetical protein